MDTIDIILIALAIIVGVAYLLKRRSRLRREGKIK